MPRILISPSSSTTTLPARSGAGRERVQTGVFGARMDVALVNDGPVTIVLDVSSVAAASARLR